MSSKQKICVLLFIVILLITYLCFSFCWLTFDISKWTFEARVFSLFLGIVLGLIGSSMYGTFED